MYRTEIGLNAGQVWSALTESGKLSTKAIKKVTKLKDKDLYAALGWLAREEKIFFEEIEGDTLIGLV